MIEIYYEAYSYMYKWTIIIRMVFNLILSFGDS